MPSNRSPAQIESSQQRRALAWTVIARSKAEVGARLDEDILSPLSSGKVAVAEPPAEAAIVDETASAIASAEGWIGGRTIRPGRHGSTPVHEDTTGLAPRGRTFHQRTREKGIVPNNKSAT